MTHKALLAIAALVFAVLLARWFEEGDYYDPVRGRHHCAAPPSAIKDWSYTGRAGQSSDLANLDRWLQRHPDQMNRLFGAFCRTPLHTAARFGREDLAERLIAAGADVRTPDEPGGNTALHLAAQYGHAAVATVLVARGTDVNAATKHGRTPLHDAAFGLGGTSDLEGRLAVARLLISHGANVNARERGSGRTPLDNAASISGNRADGEQMTELLLAAGADARTADSQGGSSLQLAASQGHVAVVKRLLDGGADPNATDRDTTALGMAAFQGRTEVVALLLARGADANRSVPRSRLESNGVPLAMAFLSAPGSSTRGGGARRLQIARMLLDHGAEIDGRDPQGRTVLHGTASRGDVSAVELLLSRRAAIDPADAMGLTPLHLAVKEGHAAVAELLLSKGADVRVRARDGGSALDFAGHDREMEQLVRRHAKR
jgi:ankyrin repeat protein